MRTVKRNEPCPCGSGKKYKKCCGSPTAQVVDNQTINTNLLKLHQELISAISTKYNQIVGELTSSYSKSTSLDEGTIEVYKTGLIPWIISHNTNTADNKTIFQDFTNNNVIPMHTKVYFEMWADQIPSVYEVIGVDKPIKQYALIKEVETGKMFHIPYDHSNELVEGSLLIGTLVPFADYHNFLYTMIKLYNRETDAYSDLIKQYSNANDSLKENFPDFFAEALTTGTNYPEWAVPAYEEVAEMFVDHMIEKSMNDQAISDGIQFWQKYCADEKPVIKKVKAYVAALDYFVQKEMVDNTDQTQGDLAQEYDISSGTISKLYRNFIIYKDSV